MGDLDLAREDRPNLKAISLLQKFNERREGPIDQFNAVLIYLCHTPYTKGKPNSSCGTFQET